MSEIKPTKKSKVKRENYINIQGWMVEDLKLKGNALLIYAIIYGFSQAENQVYNGGLQYLADWTNSTKQGVIKVLKTLCESGYIEKKENVINGVKFCEYYVTKFNDSMQQSLIGSKQSLIGGIKQSLNNNIYIDTKDNNIYKESKKEEKKKTTSYDEILNDLEDEEIKQAMLDFIKMRKLIKKPLTDKALKLSISNLFKLSNNKDEMIEIINQSVMNSWQSFYPLKKENNKNKGSYFKEDLAF